MIEGQNINSLKIADDAAIMAYLLQNLQELLEE